MEIKIVGSTNGIITKEESLSFSRAAARVCYSKFNFSDLMGEDDKQDLIGTTLKSGHHSVYDHVTLNLYIDGLPKIGAMLLNNEQFCSTSEKSARYTQMQPVEEELKLYQKWLPVFQQIISQTYPFLKEDKVRKLAQENARYVTSVFTPTKMLHTFSFRQLNYLMHFFDRFQEEAEENEFTAKVKGFMREFNQQLSPLYVPQLDPELKKRRLSLFAQKRTHHEEFGENYSIGYEVSFACLAQLHRHRTINYEMQIPTGDNDFFVPPILSCNPNVAAEWESDIRLVRDNFPQGMLVKVHEFGHYRDFISKMNERLCGQAQWEAMNNTRKTLSHYIKELERKEGYQDLAEELKDYSHGPKCTFPDTKCSARCAFGPELGLERLV